MESPIAEGGEEPHRHDRNSGAAADALAPNPLRVGETGDGPVADRAARAAMESHPSPRAVALGPRVIVNRWAIFSDLAHWFDRRGQSL
jgi:hypothetical protein